MSSHFTALWCASPVFFLSFQFIRQRVLRAALDAFGLGRMGSVSRKSLPPMSCADKWVWEVLSKALCVLGVLSVNAKSISLCSGILREVLTKHPWISAGRVADSCFFSSLLLGNGWTHTYKCWKWCMWDLSSDSGPEGVLESVAIWILHCCCEAHLLLSFSGTITFPYLISFYSPTQFAMCRRLPHYLLWVSLELFEGIGNCISWKVLFGDDA